MDGGAPYTVRLDPDIAQQLAGQGGSLLVLDLPEGSYFGIDHMAFYCGPLFRGVKMLPPGPHFVCYSVPGSKRHGGGMGPITGFFVNIKAGLGSSGGGPSTTGASGTVIVRRYDPCQELLADLPEEEGERFAHGVRKYEFDWGLAPYNLHAWRQWRELTTCLDERVIDAVQPVERNICTAMEASDADYGGGLSGEEEGRPATEAEGRLRRQLQEGRATRAARAAAATLPADPLASDPTAPTTGQLPVGGAVGEGVAAAAGDGGGGTEADSGPGREAAAGSRPEAAGVRQDPSRDDGGDAGRAAGGCPVIGSGRCFYSELPRLVKESGLSPAELTAANLDRTPQLTALAARRWCGEVSCVVGEMQFAFIAFVFGQSLQGFRQWRALVTLLLNCEEGALTSHAPAFTAFVAALRAQLALALTPDTSPYPSSSATAAAGVAEPLGGGGLLGGLLTPGSVGQGLVEEVLLGGGGRDCFLRHHLGTFFEVLREAGPQGVDARLQAEASQLRAVLSRVVGWDFDGLQVLEDDEDDEYAPVVVELPEGTVV